MSQDQQELTLEESVKQVMQTLPPVIRDYLSQGKYTPVARSLMATYGLRIDQGGVLEREIMLLLMGIENPDEFSKALVEEAKLDQQTVNGIMQDVNTQIFVPLRDEMRKGPAAVLEAAKPAAAQPPRPDWGSHASANLPPRPTVAPSASPTLVEVKPPQVLIPPPSQKPALRDILATVMKAPLAPPNLPGVMPETRPSPVIPKVELQVQPSPKPIAPAAPANPQAPPKPLTSYSIDPYREPLDEK